jgi:hypothetical protein
LTLLHTQTQENAWSELALAVDEEFGSDWNVTSIGKHHREISNSEKTKRKLILNFAGTDLFVHYDDGGGIPSLPHAVRVEDDGSFRDLGTNSIVTSRQIIASLWTYLGKP